MDAREQQMLEESLRLAQENNGMLKKMIWAQRRASIMRAVYWAIIIFITIASYYIVKPYLDMVMGVYSGGDVNKLLDAYQQSQ